MNASKRRSKAYAAGLLGKNIQGSGIDFDLYQLVAPVPICAAKPALLESLEQKGKPLQTAVSDQLRPLRLVDHHQQHRIVFLGAVDHPQRR